MFIIIGGTVTGGVAIGIRGAVLMNKPRKTDKSRRNTIAYHAESRGMGSDTTGWSTIGGLPGLTGTGPGSRPIVLYIVIKPHCRNSAAVSASQGMALHHTPALWDYELPLALLVSNRHNVE